MDLAGVLRGVFAGEGVVEPLDELVCAGGGVFDGDAAEVADGFGFGGFEDADDGGDAGDGLHDVDGIVDAAHGCDDEFGVGGTGVEEDLFIGSVATDDGDAEAVEVLADDGVVIDDEDFLVVSEEGFDGPHSGGAEAEDEDVVLGGLKDGCAAAEGVEFEEGVGEAFAAEEGGESHGDEGGHGDDFEGGG